MLGGIPLIPVANSVAEQNGLENKLFDFYETTDFTLIGMEPWLFLFLMLIPFVVALGLYFVAVTQIHKKPVLATVTARPKFDWKRMAFAVGVWLALAAIFELIAYFIQPELYSFNFRPDRFFPVLIVSVLLLPLQVSTEEIVFRGYLMQGVALLANNRWVPLIVTSVLFGLMHFANPETAEFGFFPAMYGYVFMGLFLGIVTLLDDGLELAIGVHFANNLFAATIATYPAAALPMPTLFSIAELNIWGTNLILTLAAGVFVFIAARKYGWQLRDLKTFLTERIFEREAA